MAVALDQAWKSHETLGQLVSPEVRSFSLIDAGDAPAPSIAGLHTEEFYRLAASRLDARGILASRLSLASVGLAGLASEVAAQINGAALSIDGGWTAR